MNIIQINITDKVGSTGQIVDEIGQLVIAKGWNSYIAYGRKAGLSDSKLIHIGNMVDEYSHGIQSRILDNHGLASRWVTNKFIKSIEMIRPDIVHLHNIHGYYLNYPILFKFLDNLNVPVVWTLHDCWPITGHCAYFDAVNCEKWKTGCYSCPNRRSYPASLFLDRSKKNFEDKRHYFSLLDNLTIVPVSYWLEGIVQESFLKKYPIITIHNGISLDHFKRYESRIISSEKPVVLGVASVWERRKGFSDFIKLSGHDDLQVVLVGVDKKTQKKLPPNIIGINRTSDQKELAEYYSRADVFVNPTYEDNFPTVNIESMACGTPVVTYRTGGSPESLTEMTGIVVEKGDVDGLYTAIRSILDKSPKEREVQRELCVKRAKEFDYKIRFKEYIDLYEKLLRNK